MRDDTPTLPNLGRSAPGASNEPGAAGEPHDLAQAPLWPGAEERARPAFVSRPAPRGYVSTTAFGVSLGANVALVIGLLGVLLLSHAGAFALRGSPGQSSSAVSALSSPTTTATSAASPTSSAGWLRVAPSSVTLGCGDGQRSQFVILQNTGPERVQWRAAFAASSEQSGVTVSPQQGDLAPGASMPIQIQNTAHGNDAQGASNQQGVMSFAPTSPDTGSPATLTYTTVGCN